MVYAEILLGAPAGERINLLHGLGAGAVAIGATWVWFKAKRGHGWAGTSANLIVVLTAVSLVLGVATKLSFKPSFNTGHYTAAVLLFLAAVWHAYEMRIYRPE